YPDESAHCASFILQGIESEHLFRSGALLSNAGVVALLPRILALSVLPAALTVLRPGDGHSGCRATLGLILALRILHRVGRVVILIPLRRSDRGPGRGASRRSACPTSVRTAVGPRRVTSRLGRRGGTLGLGGLLGKRRHGRHTRYRQNGLKCMFYLSLRSNRWSLGSSDRWGHRDNLRVSARVVIGHGWNMWKRDAHSASRLPSCSAFSSNGPRTRLLV